MSHNKERKEKICLNCKAAIYGRYCHACGQENIEPKEGFLHLVNHFVEDITHFDGKFFVTLKDLLFKPGFLSAEYLKGRRASYLHPIRMYVFTSAVFFLIFFSFIHLDDKELVKFDKGEKQANKIHFSIDSTEDGEDKKVADSFAKAIDSLKIAVKKNNPENKISGLKAKSVKEYDSVQLALPVNKRDGWFKRIYERRLAGINQNLRSGNQDIYRKLGNELVHSIPKMMFILLPLIALVLRLLYIRRKQFLYIDHAIFIIHLFIAIYMFWLFSYCLSYIGTLTGWGLFKFLAGFMFVVVQFYQYKAMRNFYKQSRLKTILKYGIFNFVTLLIFIFIGVIFFLNTASEQIN